MKSDADIESDRERDQNVIYQVDEGHEHSSDVSFTFKPLTRTIDDRDGQTELRSDITRSKMLSETEKSDNYDEEDVDSADKTESS